jgi:hypothetical protein
VLAGLAIALLFAAWAPLHAADPPVAEHPSFAVGESWTWRRTQTRPPPGDAAMPVITRRIVSIAPDGSFRTSNVRGPNHYDASLNIVAVLGEDYKRILFRFPLKVGDRWTWTRKVNPEYPDVAETGTFHVVSYESITVPAGTFECFRIRGDMSLTGRHVGTITTTDTWYCPSIRQVGKLVMTVNETRTPGTGPGVYNTDTSELLSTTVIGPAK